MRKILLFLCMFLSIFYINGQNVTIANGISAESFQTINPIDSLNILTATQKTNGISNWKKINIGQIKSWINNQNVINGIKDYNSELNLQNNFQNSKVKIESSNGQYNIVELSTGNIKFSVNKFIQGFNFYDNTGYFTLKSGVNEPISLNSDKNGDLYLQRSINGGLWNYLNNSWSKIASSQDMSEYLTSINASNTYATINSLNTKANSSSISAVGFSGNYNDLANKPIIPIAQDLSNYATQTSLNTLSTNTTNSLSTKANMTDETQNVTIGGLKLVNNPGIGKVLTSDAYGFGTWQTPVASDPNSTNMANYLTIANAASSYATINSVSSKANSSSISSVGFSGNYTDLSNKPDLSNFASQSALNTTNTNLNNKANTSAISSVGFSGGYSDLLNKPDLTNYATTSSLNSTNSIVANKANTADVINTYSTKTALQDSIANIRASIPSEVNLNPYLTIVNASSTYATQTSLNGTNTALATKANSNSISSVGFSGNYIDLLNKPVIPTSPDLSPYLTIINASNIYTTQTSLNSALANKADNTIVTTLQNNLATTNSTVANKANTADVNASFLNETLQTVTDRGKITSNDIKVKRLITRGTNDNITDVSIGDNSLLIGGGGKNIAIGSSTLTLATSATNNIAIGNDVLKSNITSSGNTAIGDNAMMSITGGLGQNTAIGNQSLSLSTTGRNNTSVGSLNQVNNTTGRDNSALGYQSLNANTTGNYNTAIGSQSMASMITGNQNFAAGYWALKTNTAGNNNISIGNYSLGSSQASSNIALGNSTLSGNVNGTFNTAIGEQSQISNIDGSNNTSIGYQSLSNNKSFGNTALGFRSIFSNTTGQGNVSVGDSSSLNSTTGSYNTILGYNAGNTLTIGSNNIIIGNGINVVDAAGNNQIAIGNKFIVTNGITKVVSDGVATIESVAGLRNRDPNLNAAVTIRPGTYYQSTTGTSPLYNGEFVLSNFEVGIYSKKNGTRVDFKKGTNTTNKYTLTTNSVNQFHTTIQVSDTTGNVILSDNGSQSGSGIISLILPQSPQNDVEFEVALFSQFGSIIINVPSSRGQKILLSSGEVDVASFSGQRAGRLLCKFYSNSEGQMDGTWIIKLL